MARVHGEKVITRRNDIDQKNHYRFYMSELKEDFHCICGYCGKSINVTKYPFEPDHFVPKTLSPEREHDYTNLVYSCFQCNRKKGKKWPTANALIPHDGKQGFVDPATTEYDIHLKRDCAGRIVSRSEVGEYMIKTFKFDSRPIKEIWGAMLLYDRYNLLLDQGENTNPVSRELFDILNFFFETKE